MKITVTIPIEEQQPYLEQAAAEISKEAKIEGFRPGHAPYNMVVAKVGAQAVFEAALDSMIRATYVAAVVADGLEVIGAPNVNVTKMAYGNEVVYEATAFLLPKVTNLADWRTLSISAKPIEVSDKEIDAAMADLVRMQTKEVRATKGEKAGTSDKLVVDLDMKKEHVQVEGGTSKGAIVLMAHDQYLPGLTKALEGSTEGETRTFTLPFPKDHYQKHLAGCDVEITATINELYHLEHPEVDDVFAKALGLDSLTALRAKINENIGDEKKTEETHRQERTMLEELAKKSTFDEIPENLIEEETHKMLEELRRHVNDYGLEFDQYISSLKKSAEELHNELRPQAEMRVKVAMVLKEIATREQIKAEEKEVDEILDRIAANIKDAGTRERIFEPEFREYQASILRNRKTIDLLRAAMVK